MGVSTIEVKKAPERQYCDLCMSTLAIDGYTIYLTAQGNYSQNIDLCKDHAEELGLLLLFETLSNEKTGVVQE